jgi:hypothetical protein
MTIREIKNKWNKEKEDYKTQEVGTGVHSLIRACLESEELFSLKEGFLSRKLESRKKEYIHEKKAKEKRKADFVIYITPDIIIPLEAECYGNIKAGIKQLFRYQKDFDKQYGILTDGFTWRFYNNNIPIKEFNLNQIFEDTDLFLEFWKEYIKPEFYYLSFFEPQGQLPLLKEEQILPVEQNRLIFFEDITKLIKGFKNKLKIEGYLNGLDKKVKEKTAIEITYAYIIQFILYKTLVDNEFGKFKKEFENIVEAIHKCLNDKRYKEILGIIDGISAQISKNIYRPFSKEQEFINQKLLQLYRSVENKLSDVSPWLDIFVFIKKYNFSNIENEIFGYIYENYLKELYAEEKKGQYFTDPSVVNFMLQQMGFTPEEIEKKHRTDKNSISIIDPACGSGTFLYSAVNQVIKAFGNHNEEKSKQIEEIVNNNIFGLDIEEFPLYLAEMNILMRMLPLIITEKYNNPVDKKIKVFKTNDSIAEFKNTALDNTMHDFELKGRQFSLGLKTALDLGYKSYMREESDLEEMKKSLEKELPEMPRRRFDYVIGNPPYISFKECSKQKVLFFELMKQKKIKMSDIYGVNLHSTPNNRKKYAPNPNLYAFFIALGIALLKDSGKLCYIIPQTILTAGDLDVIRYHLAKFTTIEKIITFSGKMFIGRGLKQDKPVPTSSLIFVINRKMPFENLKDRVEIINYKDPNDTIEKTLQNILKDKKISRKEIPQTKLLQNVANWNFIKQSKQFLDFYEDYKRNTNDISIYYEHILAEQKFGNRFYFDRGLKYPKNKINYNLRGNNEIYFIAINNRKGFKTLASQDFIDSQLLDFPFGSQGEIVYKEKYKIVWSYINYDCFRFSEENIMIDYNNVLISSGNKNELLYLLAILNSPLSVKIFDSFFRNENEKDILIGIKTIKEFIRIPKINDDNQFIKKEIIKQTEEMLALEEKTLSDFVDFSRVMVQKFDDVFIESSNLILEKDKEKIKIQIKGDKDLVKKTINEKYNKGLKLEKSKISLSDLKTLPVLDYDKQKELKDYIDDLVFALYFNIGLEKLGLDHAEKIKEKCSRNPYYDLVNNKKI